MTGLAWTLARAGGRPRMLLVLLCTSLVSGLLLVAVSMLLLPAVPQEQLFNLVAEPGLRTGTAFSTVLLTLPVLLLLYQAVRLGTAARERRLAALRVAGATPRDVRLLGGLEVGLPALAGGLLGTGVYAVLRGTLGGSAGDRTPGMLHTPDGPDLALVPTSVAPSWWQTLLVAALVGATGFLVGRRASARLVLTPLGVARSVGGSPPRPWGLLALALAPLALAGLGAGTSDLAGLVAVALATVGLVGLSSWAAYTTGRLVQRRAWSAAALLAARRLVEEPRPAGRAGAAVGGVALVAGGTAVVAADVLTSNRSGDPFFAVSFSLIAVALLAGLAAAAGALAVHSVETVLDRRRSTAALAAAGVPLRVLERAQRYEAAFVALPMAVAGLLLGTAALAWTLDSAGIGVVTAVLAGTLALVLLAIVASTRLVRPWLRKATDPANLRTE